METMRMITEIQNTINCIESEKASLLDRISILDERTAFYRTAIESLEKADPLSKDEPKQEPVAEAEPTPKPEAPVKVRKPSIRGDAKYIEFNGETNTIPGWARKIGIDPHSLRDRLSAGWSLEKALTTPAVKKYCPPATFEFNGKTKTVREWAIQYGINPGTLHNRLKRMPIEEALLTPLDNRGRSKAPAGGRKTNPLRGKVFMYDSHHNVLRQYTSIGDASRDLHISPEIIEKTIRNVSIKDQIASRNYYLAIAS